MFSTKILKIRKYDEHFFKNFIMDTETNYNLKLNTNIINTSNIKTTIIKICYLNKQLKILKEELKNNLSDDNWNKNLNLCENIKKNIKILLEIMKHNKLQFIKKELNKHQQIKKKKKEKNKEWTLKRTYADKIKNHLASNIENWIKLKQNEIDREKEKIILHKNADIVLSDVRANRIDVKKFLIILKELDNLRKVKVTIAKVRGELIALEADEVFNNIIVKLMQQWIRLDREYFLEEKGLNLMIKTGNEQKIYKNTKNLYEEWERVLFETNLYINDFMEKSKNFIILRTLWDKYINVNEGSAIPVGWVIPSKSCNAWLKCY